MTLQGRAFTAAVEHGGSLDRARALFPGAPEPWIDLSTGINPTSYPLLSLPATALTRLPEPGRVDRLREVAAAAYRAPSGDAIVAAPGTQVLLPLVASLVRPGVARVLGPTYAEHARAAALAGHAVEEVTEAERLAGADLAVVVNPNNPDGRVSARSDLLDLAATLRARGGLLVVDEAFMDVGPRQESLVGDVEASGMVVLRSFGKFFGLAGVRLGFAVASPATASALRDRLGPWAVSGAALEYGLAALADRGWQDAARQSLAVAAARLDALLDAAGLPSGGGTSLFRHRTTPQADAVFRHLAAGGVLVRRFADRPLELRIGLPGEEGEWMRLAESLRALAAKGT